MHIESRLNIWVINFFAGTPDSGWGERHYLLSKGWIEQGYKVTIVSSSYNHLFTNPVKVKGRFKIEKIDGRDFCWLKTPKYKSQSFLRFWSMWVFAFRSLLLPINRLGVPDVVIISSMPIFSILPGIYFKWKFRSKFIFEVRDLWPLSLIELGGVSPRHPAVKLIGWFERLGYKRADKIVSLLPAADTYINSISGDPSKFLWIPNGADDDSISKEEAPSSFLEQIPPGKFIVGYTGSFGHANALSYLVAAARILSDRKDVHFVLIGDGHQKQELMKEAQGIQNVTFLPQVKKSQVMSLISRFDVCYIGWCDKPLYNYGVSANKYFDYMIASKPILVSAGKINDPVMISGGGLSVEPENEHAIVEGILKLFSMTTDERMSMGLRGREYVLKYHNFNYLSSQYEKLFN